MKLFVLKCRGGYVRGGGERLCSCVPLEKASVYNENTVAGAGRLAAEASADGFEDVRLVEIAVIEKDNPGREKALEQDLRNILSSGRNNESARREWEYILLQKLVFMGEKEFVDLAGLVWNALTIEN